MNIHLEMMVTFGVKHLIFMPYKTESRIVNYHLPNEIFLKILRMVFKLFECVGSVITLNHSLFVTNVFGTCAFKT